MIWVSASATECDIKVESVLEKRRIKTEKMTMNFFNFLS